MMENTKASQALIRAFFRLHPGEAARALASTPVSEALDLLETQAGDRGAQVFQRLDPDRAVALMEHMEDPLFRRLWSAMDEGAAASLLARLSPENRSARLSSLPVRLADEMKELMSYPPGSAGQIMDCSVTVFSAEETAEEALTRIRTFPERRILDLCVVDDDGKLTAVLPLQEVAVAQPDDRLGQLAHGPPVYVQAMSSREEVVELLEAHKLASLPVIGGVDGGLCGIIRHDALVVAARHEASGNVQTMVGAGREERALSGPVLAVRNRLPWLQVNLGTAFLAAAAVALFEDTIARFTALAIFLPVGRGPGGQYRRTGAGRGLSRPGAARIQAATMVSRCPQGIAGRVCQRTRRGAGRVPGSLPVVRNGRASARSGRVHGIFHVHGQSHGGAHSHCAYRFGKGPGPVGVDLPDHRNRRHRIRQLSGPGDPDGHIIRDDTVA